jgi:hypothetical protein
MGDRRPFPYILSVALALILLLALLLWSRRWGLKGDILGTWEDVDQPGYVVRFKGNEMTVTDPEVSMAAYRTLSSTYKWESKTRISATLVMGLALQSWEVAMDGGDLLLTDGQGVTRRFRRLK